MRRRSSLRHLKDKTLFTRRAKALKSKLLLPQPELKGIGPFLLRNFTSAKSTSTFSSNVSFYHKLTMAAIDPFYIYQNN